MHGRLTPSGVGMNCASLWRRQGAAVSEARIAGVRRASVWISHVNKIGHEVEKAQRFGAILGALIAMQGGQNGHWWGKQALHLTITITVRNTDSAM
jgi:hypothetical protein